jgi:hypothetical protein
MAKKRRANRSVKQASHAPEAVAQNKKLFLAQLEAGCTPGRAAKRVGVGYSTVYGWKSNDRAIRLAIVHAADLEIVERNAWRARGAPGHQRVQRAESVRVPSLPPAAIYVRLSSVC